jgi:hypothetical protein
MGVPGSLAELPASLADLPVAGLFSGNAPASGRARRYLLNCEPWEPHVTVGRWFVLPEGKALEFRPSGDWGIPDGTVLGRTFFNTASSKMRIIETRVIVVGAGGGFGASYRWNVFDNTATRVDEPAVVGIGGGRQWLLPPPEPVLGSNPFSDAFTPDLSTRQLNREGTDEKNQILAWAEDGLITGVPGAAVLADVPALARLTDGGASLQLRVRSYLDANCAGCHRPGGASRGLFDARFETPLAEAGIIDGALAAGDLGIPGAKVIVPGDPARSILLRRTASRDLFRMPPIQLHQETSPVVPLMEEWIRTLAPAAEASSP